MTCILANIVNGRWAPGIGDPSLYGWITVVLYIAAGLLCLQAARIDPVRRERIFWLVLAVIYGLLAINKQLDLQSWLTQVARDLARAQGWYEYHRMVQRWFIFSVAISAILFIAVLLWLIRDRPWPCWLGAVGLVFTAAFVVARAASFHHVDHLLGVRVAEIPLNFSFETAGILLSLAGACLHMKRVHHAKNLNCQRSVCYQH